MDAVFTGAAALDWAESAPYDVIILDILLPEVDGLAASRELRQRGNRTPILMLTARDAIDDRVAGLDAGADDYLVKPFTLKELLACRGHPQIAVLVVADLSLDPTTHRVTRDGKTIDLSAKEFAVLECLMCSAGRVLTRTQIAERVWNYEAYNQSNMVDVYIRNLRRKIGDAFEPKLIHTLRGVGYPLFRESDEA